HGGKRVWLCRAGGGIGGTYQYRAAAPRLGDLQHELNQQHFLSPSCPYGHILYTHIRAMGMGEGRGILPAFNP
ncbi:hypothetical protein, partial [Erwinia persicina]|uniref:hypothetical protein n=1 Tax=Erwinia persicina TaxID=55211 RepID=UPI001A7EE9F3